MTTDLALFAVPDTALTPDDPELSDEVTELAGLPIGSVVLDRDGSAWQSIDDGVTRWMGVAVIGTLLTSELIDQFGPITLVYVPTEEADRG